METVFDQYGGLQLLHSLFCSSCSSYLPTCSVANSWIFKIPLPASSAYKSRWRLKYNSQKYNNLKPEAIVSPNMKLRNFCLSVINFFPSLVIAARCSFKTVRDAVTLKQSHLSQRIQEKDLPSGSGLQQDIYTWQRVTQWQRKQIMLVSWASRMPLPAAGCSLWTTCRAVTSEKIGGRREWENLEVKD